MSSVFFEIMDATASYGRVVAVDDVSLTVPQGVFACLIGPNGAGKTTLLRAVAGLVRLRSGRLSIDGRRLDNLSANRIAREGVGLVPEGRRIFSDHTVKENLLLGGFSHRRDRDLLEATLDEVLDLFPRLAERSSQTAGTLSGGEAQMLAIGRALMLRPRILLLDEPSLGLAPLVVTEIMEHLSGLNVSSGLTVLLVEQNVRVALQYATEAHLLSRGRLVLSGNAKDIEEHPEVQRVYFGAEPS